MEIRRLRTGDDRAEISRVYEESWKTAYKGIIPQEYLDSIPEGGWASGLDQPSRHTLLCTCEGRIVGTASFSKSRFEHLPSSGEIISIYFLPEYTGRGYGKALLNAAINELQQMGFYDIFLWVLEENLPARGFYEKIGFAFSGEFTQTHIGGKLLREMRYNRTSDKKSKGGA